MAYTARTCLTTWRPKPPCWEAFCSTPKRRLTAFWRCLSPRTFTPQLPGDLLLHPLSREVSRPIDVITLEEQLRQRDKLSRVGGVEVLAVWLVRFPPSRTLAITLDRSRQATLRRLIRTSSEDRRDRLRRAR